MNNMKDMSLETDAAQNTHIRQITVDAVPGRLDNMMTQYIPELSRARSQALIKEGYVKVNDNVITKASFLPKAGDQLSITIPQLKTALPSPRKIALDIFYEDEDIIVVNKPAGMVVHPGAGTGEDTLVHALLYHCADSLSGIGGVARPGIVHRLDKLTSGLLVCAKNDRAHQGLAEQFADHGRSHALKRAYSALVWGMPKRKRGTIEAPIGRARYNRLKMAVVDNGREAITHYEYLQHFTHNNQPVCSLVRCQLETGRTHQIRVHMEHIGHPLVGDPEYGRGFRAKSRLLPIETAAILDAFPRQALHAHLLAFVHPVTGKAHHFEAPLPADMHALLTSLQEFAQPASS